MDFKPSILFALIVLCSSLHSEVVRYNFVLDYHNLPAGTGYVATDLSIASSLPQPSRTYCTGETYSASPTVQSSYVAPYFAGRLGNAVTDTQYQKCLIALASTNPNQGINWLNPSQMSTLYSNNIWTATSFDNAVASMPHSESAQPSQYITADPSKVYSIGGNDKFTANIGLFCRGKVQIVSTSHPSLNKDVISPYLGSIPASTITLPSSPATVSLQSRLVLEDCIASGKTVTKGSSDGCTIVNQVWMYHKSAALPSTTSTPITISVENPFTCADVKTSQSQNSYSVGAGQTITFSFTIKNDGVRDLYVKRTDIKLDAASITAGFKDLAITLPAADFKVTKGGGSTTVQATVTAPTAVSPPAHTLKVNIQSTTSDGNPGTTADQDCKGQTPTCTNSVQYSVTTTPVVTQKPDYVVSISPPTPSVIYVGDDFSVTVATRNTGLADATSESTTSVFFPPSQTRPVLVPARTATGPTSTHSQSVSFTCFQSGTISLSAAADAIGNTIDESNENNNQASINVICREVAQDLPDYTVSIAPPASSQIIFVGESFPVAITTTNIGKGSAESPSVTRVSFPNSQVKSIPVSPLSAGAPPYVSTQTLACHSVGANNLIAIADYSAGGRFDPGAVVEENENNNNALTRVTCQPAPESCSLAFYVGQTSAIHKDIFSQVDSARVEATCFDGSGRRTYCPAMSWSVSPGNPRIRILPKSTSRAQFPSSTMSLFLHNSETGAFSARASSSDEIFPLSCSRPFTVSSGLEAMQISCRLQDHPSSIMYPGDDVGVEAICFKDEVSISCPSLKWSTDAVGGLLSRASTSPGPPPIENYFFVSEDAESQPARQILIECFNPAECAATCKIDIDIVGVPSRLECSLVNHASLFEPSGDQAEVKGVCYNDEIIDGNPVSTEVECPELWWYTTIEAEDPNVVGAHLEPETTMPQLSPVTVFHTDDAFYPQDGYIDAMATDSNLDLFCEASIGIQIGETGIDYIISEAVPMPLYTPVGETVSFRVSVKNTGPTDSSYITDTLGEYSSGCAPIENLAEYGPLQSGQERTSQAFECRCDDEERKEATFTADYSGDIPNEVTTENNKLTIPFYCGAMVPITCLDYV